MSKESITMHDLNEIDRANDEHEDKPVICVCYTCFYRTKCSDATPTVVMCDSYEADTEN